MLRNWFVLLRELFYSPRDPFSPLREALLGLRERVAGLRVRFIAVRQGIARKNTELSIHFENEDNRALNVPLSGRIRHAEILFEDPF